MNGDCYVVVNGRGAILSQRRTLAEAKRLAASCTGQHWRCPPYSVMSITLTPVEEDCDE